MLEPKTVENEGSGSGDQGADRIRIRPNEFTVPSEDPFKNDLLDRKTTIEGLTRIIGSAQSPFVISVDAAWGSGKTAFLDMWCQHLENEGFTVVQFNAWQTDFAESPFQALSAETTQRLERFSDSTVQQGMTIVKKRAREAVVAISKSALRGTGTLVPGGTLVAEAAIGAFESRSEDPISDYQQTRTSLREFTESIGHVAETVSGLNDGKPLVVAIDELDRCRPTYAIELIETVKHIFSVENVVFILAINSTALTHSAKSMYGAGFDAERYFRRFFDLQFRLPAQNRESFANELLQSTNLHDFISSQPEERSWSLTLANALFRDNGLSLRDVEQAAHRLGLVFGVIDEPKPWTAFCALIGLSVMVYDPEIYVSFLGGDSSDEEVFQILSRNLPFEDEDLARLKPQVEGAVIALGQSRFSTQATQTSFLSSRLIVKHKGTIEAINSGEGGPTKHEQYALDVIEWFERFWDFLHNRGVGSTLIDSLRYLELLLPQESTDSDSTQNGRLTL